MASEMNTDPVLRYNNAMHILLIHQAFTALHEPGGTRHFEMAHYLASHGHRVTVIASPVSYLTGKGESRASHQEIDGVTILRSYTYPALHRSFFHRVISFLSFMVSSFITGLQVDAVDIVWGTSPPIFQGGTAWALARIKKAAFLFEVRDLWPAFAVGMGVLKNPLLIYLAERYEKFLYTHADRVVVNSPGFTDHVTSRGARRVDLVPNGADPAMFDVPSDSKAYRQQAGLNGKFIVLYAGAHGISNDLDVVLSAASQLSQHKDILFVLLGDGKEKPRLVDQAKQMGLENVRFLPPVPKNQMPESLAMADACLAILKPIPLYKTVYPNKVFDYMAAGKAVILMIDGVIRQVIQDAQAGFFISPGDAPALARCVLKLAQDPAACRQMGENGRRYIITHFDRSVLASQLERILLTLISNPQKPAQDR